MVLITPRAVQDLAVAGKITEEFRRKMKNLEPFDTSPKTGKSRTTESPRSSGKTETPEAP